MPHFPKAQYLPAKIQSSEAVYTKFGKWEKRYIVCLIAVAGWFSTLSSFIYYPVIDLIANDLDTTVARINLTVTSYMVVSGLAPAFIGDAADIWGRRPLYIITLTIYCAANIGIALSKSFTALLLLRMLQSAGISGTFSIAYGVIADISTPAERGGYVGFLTLGITTAPSIGPILGGVLGARAGWRWIFWFLAIFSGLCLAAIILTLPETERKMVGNGSVRPRSIYRIPVPRILRPWKPTSVDAAPPITQTRTPWHFPNPISCLKILCRKDSALVVLSIAILYMTYCCIQASLSSLFIETYQLRQLDAGLIYLPFGIGNTVATLLSAKILNRDYKITARASGLEVDRVHGDDLSKFPIEKARLRSVFVPVNVAVMVIIGYGWSLENRTHIAVPLVLQFFIGFTIQMCFNATNTLLTDINQHAPATAQASSNLVRCALAAGAIAFLQQLIDRISVGWCFTIFGGGCLGSEIIFILERKRGMNWRLKIVDADLELTNT